MTIDKFVCEWTVLFIVISAQNCPCVMDKIVNKVWECAFIRLWITLDPLANQAQHWALVSAKQVGQSRLAVSARKRNCDDSSPTQVKVTLHDPDQKAVHTFTESSFVNDKMADKDRDYESARTWTLSKCEQTAASRSQPTWYNKRVRFGS